MAGRPSTLRINVTSDSRQARRDIQQVETTTSSSLGKLKSAGPGLAAAAGAAIGAALIAAVGEALAQGQIKGKLAAQLGATGDDAKRLGKAAGALYTAGITEDFQGAADAIRATMQNLVPAAPGEDLKDLATRAQDLATVMDEDVNATTRAAAQLLRTGLAKSGREAFDILTKGAQNGANSSQDLLDTFNEYGTQFRQLGLDGQTALGLITQGLAGGARDSDIVADSLKELGLRVRDVNNAAAQGALKTLGLDGKAMAEAFAKGGPEATKALDLILDRLRKYKGTTEGTTLATALLGTQSEDLQGALFAMDPSLAKSAKGMDGLKGASDGVAKSLRDNAGAQVTAFQRTAQQGLVDFLGEKVIPAAKELWHWYQENLAPAVAEVAKVVRDQAIPMWDKIKKSMDKVKATVDDNSEELKTLWGWIKKGLEIWGKYQRFVIGFVVGAITTTIDTIATLVRWLKQAYTWVSNLIKALGRIKIPGALGKLGGLIGSVLSTGAQNLSVAPQNGPQTMAAGLMASPFAVSPTQALRSLTGSLEQPIVLNVTIDGQQLQGRVNRTVRTALNADGARLIAGGYI